MTQYDLMLSYKFTGVPTEELDATIVPVREFFENQGVSTFCSYGVEFKGWETRDIYDYCLEQQKNSKNILFFVNHPQRSNGMIYELEKAKELDQQQFTAIRSNLTFPIFTDNVKQVIEFGCITSLLHNLEKEFDMNQLR